MKDSYARDRLIRVDERLEKLEGDMGNIKQITIRYCPKCKHETVQRRKNNNDHSAYDIWLSSSSTTITSHSIDDSEYFLCTVCGSTIKCNTKHICEIYKPAKEG